MIGYISLPVPVRISHNIKVCRINILVKLSTISRATGTDARRAEERSMSTNTKGRKQIFKEVKEQLLRLQEDNSKLIEMLQETRAENKRLKELNRSLKRSVKMTEELLHHERRPGEVNCFKFIPWINDSL